MEEVKNSTRDWRRNNAGDMAYFTHSLSTCSSACTVSMWRLAAAACSGVRAVVGSAASTSPPSASTSMTMVLVSPASAAAASAPGGATAGVCVGQQPGSRQWVPLPQSHDHPLPPVFALWCTSARHLQPQ